MLTRHHSPLSPVSPCHVAVAIARRYLMPLPLFLHAAIDATPSFIARRGSADIAAMMPFTMLLMPSFRFYADYFCRHCFAD